jgi:hypothetical protein
MGTVTTRAGGLLETVFTSLNTAGTKWALLRGRSGLGMPGRDVDLLVAAEDLAAFEDVVFELRGVALPRSLHPWHRFYVLPARGDTTELTLDVVTELVYGRPLMLSSGLEQPCLDRRVAAGPMYVLDPTDAFWTVLLHCLLDKQAVNERRAGELGDVGEQLDRPSPGEAFFASLCPPGWSADRAIAGARAGDWDALLDLGRQILSARALATPTPVGHNVSSPLAAAGALARRARVTGAPARRAFRAVAAAAYPTLWRRAGMGVTPSVLDLVEAAGAEATVVDLRRRLALCDVVLLVPDGQEGRLLGALQGAGYRRAGRVRSAHGWHRLSATGLERVRLVSPMALDLPPAAAEAVRSSSRPLGLRTHCRRATPAWSLLLHGLGGWGAGEQASRDGRADGAQRLLVQAGRLAEEHGVLGRWEASMGRKARP